MRATLLTAAALTFFSVTATTAGAQDDDDAAAWFGMMFSPYGALPALVSPAMAGLTAAGERPAGSFEIKYGRWGFEEEETWNIFGLGGRAGGLGFTGGYGKCSGCDEGFIMGQVDFEWILARSPVGTEASGGSLALGLRPSAGFGKPTEGEGTAMALTVDLPAVFSMPVGERSHIVPFVTPGIGFGRISGGGDGESGVRAALAAGVAFFVSDQFGVHVGWRKVFIDEGPSTFGVGVSFGR